MRDMGFSLPFFKKKAQKSVFFGLYITDASAFGFVFEITNGKTYIISQNTYNLTSGFDTILEDIDNLISELELKTNLHLNQTIFFLHSWMIDGETYEIKTPYKDIIKKLSQDLELKPLGYIDVNEALEKYFKMQLIVNAIVIEVNKTKFGVSVMKGNKIIHSQYIARTDDVGDDLNSVFEELPKHVILPNVMKVFGDEDKAEVASKLAQYKWSEKIFSQHPTIEIIKQDELNQTLVETFAKEMISEEHAIDKKSQSPISISTFKSNKESSTNFGFVENKDILLDQSLQHNIASTDQNILASNTEVIQNINISPKKRIIGTFRNLLSLFGNRQVDGSGKNKIVIMSAIILLSVVSVLILYEYFLHTLHIKVYLKSKTVDQTFDIDIPIKDTDTSELAVVKKSVSHEYSNKKQATGTREIGEKATGSVTIKNFDNKERTFTKGTILSKGSLNFLLDKNTKIPAGETTIDQDEKTTAAGKVTVTITAENIGQEYNIAKNTELNIADLSNLLYVANADEDFTGGTKKEVTTISKKDMDALEEEAKQQAEKNIDNILGEQTSNDEIIIPDLTQAKIADTNFSGEVGEEAVSLSIKAASEIDYYTIKQKLLLSKLQELFSEEVKNDYKVDPDNIDYKIENIEDTKNKVALTIQASATTHKDIELDKVKTASRFHILSSLEKELKNQFEIEKIEVDQPLRWVPVLSTWTPFFTKNINISTSVR